MTGCSISRRHALQGAGAAAALGLLPARANAPIAPMAAAALLESEPHITLGNGVLTAQLYPPGETAFYDGTRFDQAGVIGSVKFHDREFYGPWFDAVDPSIRDYAWIDGRVYASSASATMGPAEEFDPVGYDTAAPGETFLLPGVGLFLRPPAGIAYDHFNHHQPAPSTSARSLKADGSSAAMRHTLSGEGFGYDYTKTLTLPPGKPQLVIAHVMRNTGTKPIITSVYDHNFVILDPGQANMTVTLPFAPPQPPATSRLAVKGNTITWPQPLAERQTASMTMSETPQPYDFTVTDTRTGASIRAQADVPASQYRLWSIKTVMAVEPYVALNIPPGGEKRWSYTYTYGVA